MRASFLPGTRPSAPPFRTSAHRRAILDGRPRRRPAALALVSCLALGAVVTCGCRSEPEAGQASRAFLSVGTAPVGGAFYTVGSAICEVVNEHQGDLNWRVNAESTGGSMENIRLLTQGKIQFAMSNSSISYFALRGEGGWEQPHEIRSVITLFPNIAMFVTRVDSGIESVGGLRGKRVFLGPEGAGFEYFVGPILEAHGLAISDLDARYGSQQSAVDLIGDGAVAAAMVGGGTPNPAIAQMAQAGPIRLIPYDEDAMRQLIERYTFFEPATIPGGTYAGIEEEYHGLNVGSAHLITHATTPDETVQEFVRLVYEHRAQIAERHRAALNMTPETVTRDNGTEYHPGAIRYFREVGLWPQADE